MRAPSDGADRGDFLEMLSPAARDRLLKGSTRQTYRAGEVFHQPGAGPRVLIVNSGLVRLYFQDPDGRQATVLYGAKASLIGIINVFGVIPDLHAQAVTDTVAVAVDIRMFRRLIAEDVETASAVALTSRRACGRRWTS